MNSVDLLPIGQLAARTGTTVATLRYYDELGLVPASARVGGKRRFTDDAVGRVHFIRRAQRLGFSLEAVQAILDDTSGEWADMVAARRAELVEQRRDIEAMIDMLDEVLTCGCRVVADCPEVRGESRASMDDRGGRRVHTRVGRGGMVRRRRRGRRAPTDGAGSDRRRSCRRPAGAPPSPIDPDLANRPGQPPCDEGTDTETYGSPWRPGTSG